jgi:glycosyltransferase involved in cell wall biosynthesis
VVIDNCSTDKTAQVALSKGALVLREDKKGKGYAIMQGFANIPEDADMIAMIDGDNSYDIREIPRLLEPLESNFGEVIVGTRLQGRMTANSMSSFNRFGNWLFTFLARVGYKTNVTDVCSGFFAWKKDVIDNLAGNLESNGFSIEMEMITKMARMGYECYSVPVSYNARNGKSNLKPVKDGRAILHAWLKNLTWHPKNSANKKLGVPSNRAEDILSEQGG